ncbi:MAG: hypothetical protein H0W20_00010 [Chthoniobacterales bacterium]|nr:hypothetical protein [Chthoniobacterales bacterium]
MLEAAFLQKLQDWALRRLAFIPEGITHEMALFVFRAQRRSAAQIRLVGQDDHELGLLAIRGVFGHPRSDFAQRGGLFRAARPADGAR